MNIVRVTFFPFETKMQSQNEFHLQPNSLFHLFAGNLHWTRGVTLNSCKRMSNTTWRTWIIQTATEMTFLGLNNSPIVYSGIFPVNQSAISCSVRFIHANIPGSYIMYSWYLGTCYILACTDILASQMHVFPICIWHQEANPIHATLWNS